MTYDWRKDAIKSFQEAIKQRRDRYLRDRLEGETAEQWKARVGEDTAW